MLEVTCTILASSFTLVPVCFPGLQPDPSQVVNRPPRARKQQRSQQQQQQRKPGDASGSTSPGGGSSGCGPASAPGSSPGASFGGSSGLDGAARLRPGPSGTNGWGQVLGGLIQLSASGHLQCPAPIVKMRAAVAALKPVRQLRPQALPIRLVGRLLFAFCVAGWRHMTQALGPALACRCPSFLPRAFPNCMFQATSNLALLPACTIGPPPLPTPSKKKRKKRPAPSRPSFLTC